MDIKNIIVHEVIKEKAGMSSKINSRLIENKIDQHAKDLSSQLSSLFKKTGLSSGSFTQEESLTASKPNFLTLLKNSYINKKFVDFVKFSDLATKEFKWKLDESAASKGGYLWFNHYIHGEEHFLSIVLLRKKAGLAFVDGLDLGAFDGIDLSTLHMACRINLSKWDEKKSDRYIAFKIGNSAQGVTEYFSKFIGCEEYKQSKEDTAALVLVVNDYCKEHKLSEIQTTDAKKFVYDQCKAWADNEEPTYIQTLSEILDMKHNIVDEKKGFLLETAQGGNYELSNEIQINRTKLRSLIRYSGQGKGISISFNSNNLGDSVIFNSKNKTLTIKEIPNALLGQLEESSK